MATTLREVDFSAIKKRQEEDWVILKSGTFRGLYDKTIAGTQFPEEVWEDRELYDVYCQDYHIYGTKNKQEIWDGHFATIDRIRNPPHKEKMKKVKLTTDSTMKTEYGWLNRGGGYFISRFADHDKLAIQICFNLDYDTKTPVTELENKGWLRIHTDDNYSGIFFDHTKPMSPKQQKKVDKYCEIHKVKYQTSFDKPSTSKKLPSSKKTKGKIKRIKDWEKPAH